MTASNGEKHLTTISRKIVNKTRILFAIGSVLQIIAVLAVVEYISIKDAVKRSSFLASSSQQTIGLLIATGDIFQLKALLSSFKSNETPLVQIVNPQGHDFLAPSNPQSNYSFDSVSSVQWDRWSLIIKTEYPVEFDHQIVGRLQFLNRVRVDDWLLLIPILLGLTILFSLVQSRILQKNSIDIGNRIASLATIFEHSSSKEEVNQFYALRDKSDLVEIEGLAKKIKGMLIRIIEAATIEKEAAIGRITAHLSHDLRAPLGTFERLLQSPDESMPSMRGAVKDSLNRLNSMIESLRHSEVENLIKKSKSSINFQFGKENLQGKADAHEIEIYIPLDDPGEVWIDPLKVERAWINLASNAIEAAKSFIRVEAEKVDTTLFIRVIDDGPGVPDEFLPKLFQRGATHGKHDGTGLGLAYVRQIMRGHGGDVTYARENGLTIFECHLPNAVDREEVKAMELEVKTEIRLQQARPKLVSICVEPPSLAEEILAALSSKISSKFTFNGKYSQGSTDILVTNNPEMAAQALEEDGDVELAEYQATLSEDLLKSRILRRFQS